MAKNVQLTVDIKGGDSVGKAAEKTKSLRQELKALQTDLQSGNLTGKAFDEGIKKAAQMKDQINDVNNRVKALATDGADVALKGFGDLANGIVGGFAAAQGAMALFGSENEDVQKSLMKVQGAVALLNGVQAINNALQSDSAAMMSLQNIRLKILTFAQARYTAAVGTATGAMKLLRIAGMAIPIMLLVTGIGLLIANFDKVKAVVIKFLGPLGTMAKYIGELAQKFTDFVGITSETERAFEKNEAASNKLSKEYDTQIELLEAMGGQEQKLYKIRLAKLNQDRLILMQKKMLNLASKEEIEKIDELATAIKVLEITEQKRIDGIAQKEAEANKKAAQERAKNKAKSLADAKKDIADKIKAFEDEQEALKQARLEAEFKLEEENEAKAQKQKEFEDAENQRKLDSIIAVNEAELDAKQNLENQKVAIAEQSAQLINALVGKNKAAALAALAIEKGAAIANVILNTQREIAAYRGNPTWSLLPDGGAAIKGANILAAKVRAGVSIATISATGISGAKSINSGGSGGSVQPPSIRGTQTTRDNNTNQRQPDTKVFVTETDIRAVSRKVDGIYSQATIR